MAFTHRLTAYSLITLCTALSSCEPSDMRKGGAQREKIIERFDSDGDGKLNEEERAVARKAREKLHAARDVHGPGETPRLSAEQRERVRDHFDKDGDGTLNEEERAAAKRALIKRREMQND